MISLTPAVKLAPAAGHGFFFGSTGFASRLTGSLDLIGSTSKEMHA